MLKYKVQYIVFAYDLFELDHICMREFLQGLRNSDGVMHIKEKWSKEKGEGKLEYKFIRIRIE